MIRIDVPAPRAGIRQHRIPDIREVRPLRPDRSDLLVHITLSNSIRIRLYDEKTYRQRLPAWADFVRASGRSQLSYDPAWLSVLEQGLGHVPYVLEAEEDHEVKGILPLALVRSPLFGKFLVSMPYVNYGGVISQDVEIMRLLAERAIELAERLDS